MDDQDLQITRRHLPHWTIEGATYFITFRVKGGSLSVEEQDLTLEQILLRDGECYRLIAATVMPDHVHLLLTPLNDWSLARIMKGIKGVSARKINILRNERGGIWQEESYDRIIRGPAELVEKISYMMANPVKRGLTENPWNYHGWYCNLEYVVFSGVM